MRQSDNTEKLAAAAASRLRERLNFEHSERFTCSVPLTHQQVSHYSKMTETDYCYGAYLDEAYPGVPRKAPLCSPGVPPAACLLYVVP